MRLKIPYFRQSKEHTCGASCLRMLLASAGIAMTEQAIEKAVGTNERRGTTRGSIAPMLRRAGLRVRTTTSATMNDLRSTLESGAPALVHLFDPDGDKWGHYALVVGIERGKILMHDPWNGEYFGISEKDLQQRWLGFRTRSKDGGWMLRVGLKGNQGDQ